MRFTHEGINYFVDDFIHFKQGLDVNRVILTEPFKALGYEVPTDFDFNGASSPSTPFIRWIIPKFFRNLKASCLHDWLCGLAGTKQERKIADEKYYILLKHVEGMPEWKCKVGYAGVRIGAFFKYFNKR